MPPPTPSPWRALALRAAHKTPTAATARPTRTPPTTTTTTRTRLFHSTRLLTSNEYIPTPPESPAFFSLPALPQSDEPKRPPLKGALPVPRPIFARRAAGAHKSAGPAFVAATAPRGARERAALPPRSPRSAWRHRMAAARRGALAAGVAALWARRRARAVRAAARSAAAVRRHRAAGAAPPRADDAHTRGTVTAATLETRVLRDPLYAPRQRASAARTATLQAARAEARKDAIQRLYVLAADFIVTEAELAARVEEVFTETYFSPRGVSRGYFAGATNVWQSLGKPAMVRDMLAELKGHSANMTDAYRSPESRTQQRQKIITGELTGGALAVLAPSEKKKAESGVMKRPN